MTYKIQYIIAFIIAFCAIVISAEQAFDLAENAGTTGKFQKEINLKNYDYGIGVGVPIFKNDDMNIGLGGRMNGNIHPYIRPNYGFGFRMGINF